MHYPIEGEGVSNKIPKSSAGPKWALLRGKENLRKEKCGGLGKPFDDTRNVGHQVNFFFVNGESHHDQHEIDR